MRTACASTKSRIVTARASPTLELANAVATARARGEQAWSLSTPSFPDPPILPTPDASWAKLTPAMGLPELREKSHAQFFGHWRLPGHRCVITAGAKAGLFATLRATLAPGARVILPTPAWPSYVDICEAAHLIPVTVPTSAETGFALDFETLEAVVRDKAPGAIIIANPCNPTGRILPKAELRALAALCKKHEVLLMLDQSFSNVIFDHDAWRLSVVAAEDNIILFDSFSKNHVLQGARVGAVMIPEHFADDVVAMHQTILSAAPTPGQKMALATLDSDAKPLSLDRQRQMSRAFIDDMGWQTHSQGGTFYFFPRVPNIAEFVAFARERNIHMLTGDAFCAGCEDHLRLCFGKSEEELEQILDLLKRG